MKKNKKLKPLIKIIFEDKASFIFICILIFISNVIDTLTGSLIEDAIKCILDLEFKKAFITLILYFIFNFLLNSILEKVIDLIFNKIERKILKKKTSSIIIKDVNNLSLLLKKLLSSISSFIISLIILDKIFENSVLLGIKIFIFIIIVFAKIKDYSLNLQNDFLSLINEAIRGIKKNKTLNIANNLLNKIKDYKKYCEETHTPLFMKGKIIDCL